MEIIYAKYTHGNIYSVTKEGEKIMINNSKIIPFESIKKEKKSECASYFTGNKNNINHITKHTIDEEITNFFFNAIHKNYLICKEK